MRSFKRDNIIGRDVIIASLHTITEMLYCKIRSPHNKVALKSRFVAEYRCSFDFFLFLRNNVETPHRHAGRPVPSAVAGPNILRLKN